VSRVPGPRLLAAGDSAVIVEFDDRIDPAVNDRAIRLAARTRDAAVAGVRDVVPTFRSVAVYFDPLRTDYDALCRRLETDAAIGTSETADPARERINLRSPIRVPVCYGGKFGPDLADVAAFGGISEAEAADIHAGAVYRVFMLGFIPGFPYMGSVDARIAAPRRAAPRHRVPAGSIGIAGPQTGIYPSESPGGWQIIGRTPLRPFDVERARPAMFAAGDLVQFYPIDASEFSS
jgi:inhibitor of KinA